MPRELSTMTVSRWVLLLGSLLGGACSVDVCQLKSRCANDPPPTAADLQACEDAKAEVTFCKPEFDALTECQRNGRVCTSAGTTDPAKSAAACENVTLAYQKCFAATHDARTAFDGG